MTDREKTIFLRREGWKRISVLPLGSNQLFYTWRDPRDGTCWRLPIAYATAKRRKDARDTRRLKAAGWYCSMGGNWCKGPHVVTKVEALALLEKP